MSAVTDVEELADVEEQAPDEAEPVPDMERVEGIGLALFGRVADVAGRGLGSIASEKRPMALADTDGANPKGALEDLV